MINSQLKKLQVAIIYDHLTTQFGGAELVLQTLIEMFPQAPLFTSVYQPQEISWIQIDKVRSSFLQHIPWLRFNHQLMSLFHPIAFETLDLSSFELVISVTAGAAKGVITNPNQLHICYQLTPPRYLYGQKAQIDRYLQSFWLFKLPGMSNLIQPCLSYLRRWDQVAAHRPDKTVAISKLVAQRIQAVYQLTADGVLYPPYRPEKQVNQLSLPSNYLLCISRLINYKRIDLAIKAALLLKQPLVVVGEGREKRRLVRLAGTAAVVRKPKESITDVWQRYRPSEHLIIFLGHCSDSEKFALLKNATALIMPGIEDFGLTGLEAASLGKPVIIHANSGIAELLKDQQTAIHLTEASPQALVAAIKQLPNLKFSANRAKSIAQQHTVSVFQTSFSKMIYQFWQQHSTISAVHDKKPTN